MTTLTNRGTGAGGAQTNKFGKTFETKTDAASCLLSQHEYKPFKHGLRKTHHEINETIVFTAQHRFKKYMSEKYGVTMVRCPDEAYIIETPECIKILIVEKKEQNRQGSVETKLWASPALKREYELLLDSRFVVHYVLCVNDYLQKLLTCSASSKYRALNTILAENNIDVLHGDDDNYFDALNELLKKHCSCHCYQSIVTPPPQPPSDV